MRIALITTDGREILRAYRGQEPIFGTAPEALLQGLAKMAELEVHVISCLQQPVNSPRQLADNIRFHSLHVPKWGWLRTGYQGCIRAVRKKLRELRPDLVHGQGTERDCAMSAVLSLFPNVLTVHGNMRLIAQVNRAAPFSFIWFAARLERWTLPRTDGVICITRHTQKAVQGLARRTWLVPNAVDETFFDIARNTGTPPTLLCVGTVSRLKNQLQLLQALDPLATQHPLQLVFLGATALRDSYCEEFFEQIKRRPWCVHRGVVDRATFKVELSQATLLILPSLEDNCPMVVLEAMAAGVPVIANRVGGVPELMRHDVNGLLCSPDHPAELREAVLHLLDATSHAQGLAEMAKREAWRRFHPLTIARSHLDIYREVLNKPS